MSGIGKAVVAAVLHSVYTPGLQSWILPTLNGVMSLLFATVFYCIYWDIGGYYMYVMAFLAAGLAFSSNMALTEILAIQRAEGRQEQIDGTAKAVEDGSADNSDAGALLSPTAGDADQATPSADDAARDTPQAVSAERKLSKRRKED